MGLFTTYTIIGRIKEMISNNRLIYNRIIIYSDFIIARNVYGRLLPRDGAFDLGLAVSVPLPIVTGIFVLLWFQSRLT